MDSRINPHWVDAFDAVFQLCAVAPTETAVILSEQGSRASLLQCAELALHRLQVPYCHLQLATPKPHALAPVRSTGASTAIAGNPAVLGALCKAQFIVDLTVEGLQHAAELPQILQSGARVLVVSNEHPEILCRTMPTAELEQSTRAAMRDLRAAKTMTVSSAAGTDLTIDLSGARIGGVWGYTQKPGTLTHWPAGLCLAFPAANTVNGQLVLAAGDLNLTFKRHLESAVCLTLVNDRVTEITGSGYDAELMRGYYASWQDPDAYAVSHVGFGLNRQARWDALQFYDKTDFNGTESRAFAGNFLFSTGANEVAGRHSEGHFDLPIRGCTIHLDGVCVVRDGVLQKY